MSKKKSFARDILPGDVIRLVYEVEVDEIGDLDAKFPSESDDLFYVSGAVIKGPLHKQGIVVEFAISGEDSVTIIKRKSTWAKIKERLASFRGHEPKKSEPRKLFNHPAGVALFKTNTKVS